MNNKVFYISVALVTLTMSLSAQDRPVADSEYPLFQKACEYFDSGDYAVASDYLIKWNAIAASGEQGSMTMEQVEYMRTVCSAELNPATSKNVLTGFLETYPASVWKNRVFALAGIACAMNAEYEEAIDWFDLCNPEALNMDDCRRMTLNHAISLIKTGQTSKGYVLLNVLEALGGGYDEDISFYKSYIDYYDGRMSSAAEGFSRKYTSKKYADWASLFSAEIALRGGQAAKAMNMTREMLSHSVGMECETDVERVLGESYYAQGMWRDADEMLSSYVAAVDSPDRLDLYQLGVANLELGDYKRALTFLNRVADADDELTQSACLHKGLASLALNDNKSALFSFERASSMTYDKYLSEQALYNYAMCLLQSDYSPFAEPVIAFERFLNEFPDSRYYDKISGQLIEVYMQSNNYDAALASIDRLHNPSSKLLAAKQELLFRKGMELYAGGQFSQVADCMTKVIDLSGYNRQLAADACFWRGETYYREGKYTTALADYNRYKSLTSNTALYGKALYGAGYSAYKNSDWRAALDYWSQLSGKYKSSVSKEMLADACARMGDCSFYQHDYVKAAGFYDQSVETCRETGDYALFRKGLCLGLKKDYQGKADVMESICKEYPASVYCANALYEEARAYLQMEQSARAINVFQRLAESFPKSDMARKALAETALIYYQNDEYSKAIPAYKDVIEKFPGSDEAVTALHDLRSIYVETGQVDQYLAYAGSLKGFAPVAADEKDSLTYTAAELLFTRNDSSGAEKAFVSYLRQYPEGAYSVNANYYLGIICQDRNDEKQALEYFLAVSQSVNSRFCTESLERAAGLAYRIGDYNQALDCYTRLYARAGDAALSRKSLVGIVRSAYAASDWDTVLKYADNAIDSRLEPEQETETRFFKAKSLQNLGRDEMALAVYRELASDTRSAYGAESSFIVSQILFDKKDLEGSEKNIMDLISAGTSHSYWLARSFILLSDIYIAQNKQIEARQYLLSLRQNYKGSDDIAAMIDGRLGKLE